MRPFVMQFFFHVCYILLDLGDLSGTQILNTCAVWLAVDTVVRETSFQIHANHHKGFSLQWSTIWGGGGGLPGCSTPPNRNLRNRDFVDSHVT
jgi:hypothetical protein